MSNDVKVLIVGPRISKNTIMGEFLELSIGVNRVRGILRWFASLAMGHHWSTLLSPFCQSIVR